MDFRNWILDRVTPVIMIVPSPEAEALVAQNNGLTIVDMLRPYGYFRHLSGGCTCFHVSNATRSFARRNWPAAIAEHICWCLSSSPCADCGGAVLPHQRAQAPLLQLPKYICPQRRGTCVCCSFGNNHSHAKGAQRTIKHCLHRMQMHTWIRC